MTLNALDGGPLPFLIAWGDTEHPSRSTPEGLTLDSFEIDHPEPAQVTPILAALGTDTDVNPASRFALVARIRGPHGVKELRLDATSQAYLTSTLGAGLRHLDYPSIRT